MLHSLHGSLTGSPVSKRNKERGHDGDMASSSSSSSTRGISPASSTQSLHMLCRRILGPSVPEHVVDSHFKSSLTLCSTSSSSASPMFRLRSAKSSEMAVAEKIKKHMVSTVKPI